MIRLIVASMENGSDEEVIFSSETVEDVPSIDLISPGLAIDIDVEIEDLPAGFPMDYLLKVDRT